MKAVLQRVTHASVTIEGRVAGAIENGFLILLGVAPGDTKAEAEYLAKKCVAMRVFSDEADKMNRSLADVGGKLLVISQFTLFADCRKGNRPNFMGAAKGEQAVKLYEYFVSCCRALGAEVETGEFGADMKVDLRNDGPVTILLDTNEMMKKK